MNFYTKNPFTMLLVAVSFVLLSGSSMAADSNEPIKIPIKNWSSQVVMAHVIGGMFESMGNNVEYVPVDNQASFEAVRTGDLTLVHEVGNLRIRMAYYSAMEKGGLIDAGTHAAETLEEMGVPNWVIEKGLCPGLPNWEALKDCHENFVTPDSDGKGRWLEGPLSWHGDVMPNRLKGLGLDDKWVVKFAGAADALWAELKAAEKEGRGTIIFNGLQTLQMLSDSLSSNFRLTLPVAEWLMAVTCLQLVADLRKAGSRKASTTDFHGHIPRGLHGFYEIVIHHATDWIDGCSSRCRWNDPSGRSREMVGR